jgi:iron complex outermembrane receptor protein
MKTLDYRTASTFALMALCAAAEAQETPSHSQKVPFDIDAPSLTQALMQFTQQSGLQLMVPTEGAADMPAPRVFGIYTPVAVLNQLLAGTQWKYEFVNPRAVSIRTADAGNRTFQVTHSGRDDKRASIGTEFVADSGLVSVSNSAEGTSASERQVEQEQASKKIPEILVKGSRVMNIDVVRSEDDVQPYTILAREMIERSGAINLDELLKQHLTMNTTLQLNSHKYASARGNTSSFNLRGLGENETLILVNGRRLAGVSINGTTYQPDINGIPLSSIERIEVLPSSASAIFGGAALGGVINIVLKKDFEGATLSYTYEDPVDGSAPRKTLSGNIGLSFLDGRTQVMLSGQHSEGSALVLLDRFDLYQSYVSTILANRPSFFYSPTNPFKGATPNIASATTANLVLDDGTPLNSRITSIPSGAYAGSDLSAGLLSNAGTYNLDLSPGTGLFGLQSPFGTVPETRSLHATIRQMLFRGISLFAEFSENRNSGRTIVNPFAPASFVVPASAPTNPFLQNVRVTFPSDVAAPQRTESNTRTATAGIIVPWKGDWSSGLDYTRSTNDFRLSNYPLDSTSFNAALRTGEFNPFVDTLANPTDLDRYLGQSRYAGRTTLDDFNLRASGSIGMLPAGRPTLTVGLGHRREAVDDATSEIIWPLDRERDSLTIFFGQSQSVDSIYLETFIPIVSNLNASPGVRGLDIQVAVRSERYKTRNRPAFYIESPASSQSLNPPQGVESITRYTATSPTIGLRYRPIDDVTFRTSFAEAFLPPTAAQLLLNPTSQCFGGPCVEILDPQNNQTYFIDFSGGGNPDLKPQTSRSWDVGLIWEPQVGWLRGVRINVEYFRIAQPNYITTPSPQTIVSDPVFADRVTRDPATGLITMVDARYVNALKYKTSGYDLKIGYEKVTRFGTLGVRTAATFTDHDLRQFSIGSPFIEYAGYPNDGGVGRLKANSTVTWTWQRWSAAWTSTYYSGYTQTFAPGSPAALLQGANPTLIEAQGGNTIGSQIYHDFFASYSFPFSRGMSQEASAEATMQFGIKNIFNTRPPLDAAFSPFFYSPYGDPRLREVRASLRIAF